MPRKLRKLVPLLTIPLVAAVFSLIFWLQRQSSPIYGSGQGRFAGVSGLFSHLFTHSYPADPDIRQELELMRATGKLKPENETLIHQMVVNSSGYLHMPPGVLWCLLFQESRLDHLRGITEKHGSRGLGQFSYFGFQEINQAIDRYDPNNLKMLVAMLGRDSRPIAPLSSDLTHPSSYYFIPTAVAASAAYLNNRFHQLKRNLERQKLGYSQDVLWLYAAMAYNKGARSVLSLWNLLREEEGPRVLHRLLNDEAEFLRLPRRHGVFQRALERVWDRDTASAYAHEWNIHFRQLQACSVSNRKSPSRMPASGTDASGDKEK